MKEKTEQKAKFEYQVGTGTSHRLGVTKSGNSINFAIAVTSQKPCFLLLYEKGEKEPVIRIPMVEEEEYGEVRRVLVEKLPASKYEYNYEIDGVLVQDPYGKKIVGKEVFGVAVPNDGSIRCGMILDAYKWGEDKSPFLKLEDVIVYAGHVRGLTKHESSKVRSKGTFRGMKERISYLKELGINQIELQPIYEFDEMNSLENQGNNYRRMIKNASGMNYWGYGKGIYFAPKASYAATNAPDREFKDLVKTLHENEMEVILEFYFPKGMSPVFIIDCMKYWVAEYHVDGFHLSGENLPLTAIALEPLLSNRKIYSEYFQEDCIYEQEEEPAMRRLAEYHDGFLVTGRRFLKGDEHQLEDFVMQVKNNKKKTGVINYLANHNGFTLMDLVSYDEKHNEDNGEKNQDGSNYNYSWNCGIEGESKKKQIQKLRMQQLRNAFAILLLSQGTPLIYGGDEFGNTQKGNNNVYCQDNELSWVCYENKKVNKELQQYVKDFIAFRKKHYIFHQKEVIQNTDYLSCGYPDLSYHGKRAWYGDFEQQSRGVGMLYGGDYIKYHSKGIHTDSDFYVAYNMHWVEHDFALPRLGNGKKWHLCIDTQEGRIYEEGTEILLKEQKTMEVPARTIVVLIGK